MGPWSYGACSHLILCAQKFSQLKHLLAVPPDRGLYVLRRPFPPCADSFPESLFGAAVPKNYDRNLQMLLAEMYDDKDYKSAQDKLEGLYQQS